MSPLDAAIADLVEAGRVVVQRGLVLASGGNLSARLDESQFVVTASGTWLDRLGPDDFSVIDTTGQVVSGNPRPSVEWKLHHHTYAARADTGAIVHLHPQHALLVDMLGHRIRCTTLDHAYYVGAVARVPFRPAGSDEIATLAAEAVRDGTKYAETALNVITVPGKASCGDCGAVFAVDSADLRCPECGGSKLTPISGRDMTISEIEAY